MSAKQTEETMIKPRFCAYSSGWLMMPSVKVKSNQEDLGDTVHSSFLGIHNTFRHGNEASM